MTVTDVAEARCKRQTCVDNVNALKAALNAHPSDTVLSHSDINEAYNDLLNDFTLLYNHCCPLRRVNNSNKSEKKNLGSRMVSKMHGLLLDHRRQWMLPFVSR